MKDVPTEFSDVCSLSIVFEREDPREVLISRRGETLDTLPVRARIGTSSLRRAAQLRRARPDLEFLEIRGNVDTRIRKLDEGEYDAIVLAKAGVTRLGLAGRITQVVDPVIVVPAVGQGALAVEYLEANRDLYRFLDALEDRETVLAVTAERAVMRTLHGGCRLPLGGYARFEVSRWFSMRAFFRRMARRRSARVARATVRIRRRLGSGLSRCERDARERRRQGVGRHLARDGSLTRELHGQAARR